jgi:hypothetical protein
MDFFLRDNGEKLKFLGHSISSVFALEKEIEHGESKNQIRKH